MKVQFAQRVLATRGGSIAVSGLAAVLAAVVFVVYLQRYRLSLKSSSAPVTVLVAKNFIEKGTPGNIVGTEDLFQITTTPKSELKEGAISDPDSLRGRVAADDIYPGEQLTVADFTSISPDAVVNKITADQRAISVPLDSAHGMIGSVHPGDRVDVFAAFNVRRLKRDGSVDPDSPERPVLKLIVEDVPVLAAPGETKSGFGAGSADKSNVTLRVSDQDAARIAFSSENGKLWVILRPKAGAEPTAPDLVTLETVLFGVKPVAAVRSFGARP
jgi:Flp pilus assembly protein CpaB